MNETGSLTRPLRAYIAGLARGGGEPFKGIVGTLTELADKIDHEHDRIISEILGDMREMLEDVR